MGLRLPQQPYIIKEWQELLHQLQSGGAGLLPLHTTHHISEDKQGLHLVVSASILLGLHDVRQQDQHFSCLYEAQNFLFVKRCETTLAKMLWPLSTSLPSGFLAGGTGIPAAASWQAVAMGAPMGTQGEQGAGKLGQENKGSMSAAQPPPFLTGPNGQMGW